MIAALIIGGIVLAMGAGAVSYYATDGWGMGNATESSEQARQKAEQEYKEQEQKQALQNLQQVKEINGRYYNQYNVGIRPPKIKDIELPQIRKIEPPSLAPILPPALPGHIWAELSLPDSAYKAPDGSGVNVFTNRNDASEINSLLDVLSSTIDATSTGKFTGGSDNYNAAWGGGFQNWWDYLNPLKYIEGRYNAVANVVDTLVWDIDGDNQDSWVKNLFVDPWTSYANGDATFGQALLAMGLNPLTGLGEDLDVFANVVKGIANNGYDGFLDAWGLQNTLLSGSFWSGEKDKPWNRQNYDWNIQTGSGAGDFFANLGAELLSDPLTVIGLAKLAVNATNAGGKAATKLVKEATEETVKKSSKIIAAQVGKAASEVGTEATEIALRQTGKKLSGEILEASAKRSSKELTKHTTKIIQDNVDTIINQSSKRLAKVIARQGLTNADDIAKVALKEVQSNLMSILVKNGIDPSSPLAKNIVNRFSKSLVKSIPYDTLSKQVLSTFSGQFHKAARMASKFDDIYTKWAFRLNFPALKLGGLSLTALSKIPVVGTVPAKFFSDIKGALARKTNSIVESVLAPITNHHAWKASKELQQQFGKNILDETVYKTTKEIFQTSTKLFDDISSETVQVNSKKVVRANLMSIQTTETAFTRQQYLRFSKDASVYEYLVKNNKGNIPAIKASWTAYIKKEYGINNTNKYLTQLRKVSQIEGGAFDTIANRIALQDAYLHMSTAHNMVKPGSSQLYKASQAQPRMTSQDFKALANAENFKTIADAKDLKIKIQDVQYGIFRRNNYLEQNDIMEAWNKLISDYEYNPKKSSLDFLMTSDDVNIAETATKLKQRFEKAKSQQNFLTNMSASGLSVGNPDVDKFLPVAFADTFFGLKNKIVDIDDIDEILNIWIDNTQIALRNYANIDYVPNLKTNDIIVSLKAQLMVYSDQIGSNSAVVTLLKDSMQEMNNLHKSVLELVNATGGSRASKAFKELDDALLKSKESLMKLSDDLVIIPNRAFNITGDAAINNIPGNLQKSAMGAFANTLSPMVDLHNISQFFQKVNGSLDFDFHTIKSIQSIADRAVNVFNKLDGGIDELIDPITKVAVDKTYDEFLRVLSNSANIYDNKGIYTILSSAATETTAKKYALLQSIKLEKNRGDITLFNLKTILDDLLAVPAYNEARIALANIKHYSKQSITINTGFNAFRASEISMQENVKVALNELNELNNIKVTTKNSNVSLQKRIELQSNSSPLLASYTKQLNTVQETFEQIITPYQNVIKMSVLNDSVVNNKAIIQTGMRNGHFSQEDVNTLFNIYDGVENTPEALAQLQRRVDDYNNTVVDVPFLKETIKRNRVGNIVFEDFSNDELESLFKEIWTKEVWNSDDLAYYNELSKIVPRKELPIPNAIRNELSKELEDLGIFKIRLDTSDKYGPLGYVKGRTSSVFLTNNSYDLGDTMFTARHELLHSALSRMEAGERANVINTAFNHLFTGDQATFIEEYYSAIYLLYYKRGVPGEAYSSLIGKPFNMADLSIREEVLADLTNIISKEGIEGLNDRKMRLVERAKAELKAFTEGKISRNEFPLNIKEYIEKLSDIRLNPDKDLEALVSYYYLSNIKSMAQRSPDATALLPANIIGDKLYVGSPFVYTEKVIKKYKSAESSRTRSIIRHRLGMSAADMAEDLARSGPFAFYSMSTLQNMQDKSGAWKWFDYDFNLRPHTKKALAEAGIDIKIIPEMDSVVFILKKDRVSYLNNTPLYNGRPTKAVKDFPYNDINYSVLSNGELKEFTGSFQAYQDAMHGLRGQSMGYSKGFKVSNDYYTKLFKGVGQDAQDASFAVWKGIEALGEDWGGWNLEDLIVPKHYTTYRFEEMIMGNSTYARRFGVYISDNPVINAANAIQQFSQVNKARTELTMNLFDETFSISKGFYKDYSNETIYKLLQEHPEYRLMIQVPKKDGVGVTEIIPYNLEQVARARKVGAVLVPDSWYKRTYNTLNHRIGSEGALKAWQSVLYIWKALALMNPMTFVRNWIDTDLKTAIEMKGDFFKYQFRSRTLLKEYNSILYDLGDNIYSDKLVREFFEQGSSKVLSKSKYMDYDLFQQIRKFDIWGPSGGLVKYMEPTADELSRQLVAEAMKEYKTWWESVTDFNTKVFDIASTTIGFNAEKRDRLAMFLKALDDGKSVEQGFHWVTKTHFDYAFRSKSDQILEMAFPFITFTQRNLEYFLKIFEEQPHLLRYFVEYQNTIWNVQDYNEDQILASQALQNQILSGNIPLFNGKDGRDYYFKLNPSFMDAFNTFVNPIGVLKDRVFLPMRAIEKATTTNYKGENQFKNQPIAQQIFEAGQQIPGMGIASQIYNSLGTNTPYPLNTAVGSYKKPPVTGYKYGGRYLEIVQWIPQGYNNYFQKNMLKTKSVKQQQFLWNKTYNPSAYGNYKRARNTALGNRVLDPYQVSGQNLIKKLYFKTNVVSKVQYNTSVTKKVKRNANINNYAVNRAAFSRY